MEEIARLSEMLADATSELASSTRSNEALESRLQESAKLAKKLEGLEKALETAEQQKSELEAKVSSAERVNAAAETDASGKIGEIEKRLEAERARAAALEEEAAATRGELEGAKKRLEALNASLDDAKKAAEKTAETHALAVKTEQKMFSEQLTMTRTTLMRERDDLSGQLAHMTTRVAGLEGQIDQLNKKLAAADETAAAAAAEAERRLAAKAAETAKLEREAAEKARLQSEAGESANRAELDEANAKLVKAKEALKAQIRRSTEAAKKDDEAIKRADAAAKRAAKERDDASSRYGEVATRVAGLEAQIDELTAALSAAEESAAAAESDAEAAKKKLTELEAENEGVISAAEFGVGEKKAAKSLGAAIDAAGKGSDSDSDDGVGSPEALRGVEKENALAPEEIDDVPLMAPKPPARIPTHDFACQHESDELSDHRAQLQTIRGQMSVLTARLMDLNKPVEVTDSDVAEEQKRLRSAGESSSSMTEVQKITEEWNDVSFEEGTGKGSDAAAAVDYKPIADALRVRCQALVAKGKAARVRISMLENELAIAVNEKEAMDQWARVCQRRAIGAEEARIGTMEELRDIKFRTRAIRLGQNTAFESQNVDLVTAAVRIEELSDRVVEVTEYFQMNKLKLEDVTRERDELLAFKENAAKRNAAKASWNALLSPNGVLERAGLTPVANTVDLETPTTAAAATAAENEALDVSGSEAAAAIEAAAEDAETAVATSTVTATKTLSETVEAATTKAETAEETAEESGQESDSAKKARKKRQADFSILEFLGLVTPEPDTPDVSMEMTSTEQAATAERTSLTIAETAETTATTEKTEKIEKIEKIETTATAETITEKKMATESSSAAAASSESVQGTGTPDELVEPPKKKGFVSLGSAIDKHGGDSDDDESESESETTTTTRASESRAESTRASSSIAVEEREETEIITTTTTRTITTTTVINSDGEEEEMVEEVVVETDADGNVLSETAVAADPETTAEDGDDGNGGDESTRGPSFWSRMNAKAGDAHPNSDSE